MNLLWYFVLKLALGPSEPETEIRVSGFASQAECEVAREKILVLHDREGWQSIHCRPELGR